MNYFFLPRKHIVLNKFYVSFYYDAFFIIFVSLF